MPISESDFKQILAGYDARRKQASYDQDLRIQNIYRNIPEIQAIDREIENFGLTAMQRYLASPGDPKTLVQNIRQRVDELVHRKELLLTSAGYPKDYMEILYECPLCKDTGYVEHQKCRCLKQRLIELAYNNSNLDAVLQTENFSTFNASFFSPVAEPGGISPRDNMLRIRDVVQRSLENFHDRASLNYLFYGTTGTGKTFMCNCIARALLDRGFTVLYLSAYDLCMYMNDHRFRYRGDTNDDTSRMIDFIDTCDLLIIDDLGTEASNNVSVADIFHCINKRILEKRSTIISTNLELQQIQKVYSDRLASRILGNYQIIKFYGEDLRLRHLRR